MVDLDSQIKALRLSWMKRIFTLGRSTWKSYLQCILNKNGGFLLFSCNYNMNLSEINSQFYRELLQWWAEFRDNFAEEKDWQFIIWNSKEILIDNKLVYYEQYFRSGIISVNDLHFDVDNLTSFNRIAKEIDGSNFLMWTGQRNSVPPNLRQLYSSSTVDVCSTAKPSFKHSKCVFDVTKTKFKHYALLIGAKARLRNNSINLKREFNLAEEQLGKIYLLPHTVTSEPYLKAFQYKVLNSILYTNDKLYKIGYTENRYTKLCTILCFTALIQESFGKPLNYIFSR